MNNGAESEIKIKLIPKFCDNFNWGAHERMNLIRKKGWRRLVLKTEETGGDDGKEDDGGGGGDDSSGSKCMGYEKY